MNQPNNLKARGSAAFTLVSGIVILLAVLFFVVKLAGSRSFISVDESTATATETRIQPAGKLIMGDGIPVGQRQGDKIFSKVCIQCHAADSTVPNAPRLGNNGDWAPRIAQGFDTLFQHALNGFNAMPAKGGQADLTDDELKRVIVYMTNKSGGSFPEPSASAASGAAASGAAASGASAAAPAAASGAAPASGEAPAATASAGGGNGQKVFETACMACHGAASPIPNVPRITKNDEWAPRIKKGKDTLFNSAINGFNTMPPKGGQASLSDDDVKAAVTYMVNQSGGKF